MRFGLYPYRIHLVLTGMVIIGITATVYYLAIWEGM